eukprot:scaffold5168_cov73-Cylindrotheca_fusiformis.AAC.2
MVTAHLIALFAAAIAAGSSSVAAKQAERGRDVGSNQTLEQLLENLGGMDAEDIYDHLTDARDQVAYNDSYVKKWIRPGEGDCVVVGNPTLERSRGNLTVETQPTEAWLCQARGQIPSVFELGEERFTEGKNCTLTTVCNLVWNCRYYDFQELCGKARLTDEPIVGGNCIVTSHTFNPGYEAELGSWVCDPDIAPFWQPSPAPSAAPTESRGISSTQNPTIQASPAPSAAPPESKGISSTQNPTIQQDPAPPVVHDDSGICPFTEGLPYKVSVGCTVSMLWWIL